MVRLHSVTVLIFIASIAAAAPLRLVPSVEPASQEATPCARLEGDSTPKSVNPQDCGKSELNVSPGEHNVLDMNSFSFSCDSSRIVLLPPFDSPSSQERVDTEDPSVPKRVDADTVNVPGIGSLASHPSGPFHSPSIQECVYSDIASAPSVESRALHPSGHLDSPTSQEHVDPGTVNVPGIGSRAFHPSGPFLTLSIQERADADDAVSVLNIESRAPHTSGPLEVVRRSIGVLSSGTSSAPDSHRLLRKRTDTDIAGADGSGPLDLHISDPLQPTSAFSTNLLSEAASPDQCKDAREQQGTVIIAHGIASHVPDCSGPLNPSSASIDHPLLQERTYTDITSAQSIKSHSTHPAGPVLVSSDMRPSKAYDFVSKLRTDQFLTRVVVDFMKSQDVPYKQDTKLSKNYNQFLQTKTGELWQDIDRLLSVLHPTFNRLFIRMKVMSDSLIEHLSSIGHVDAAKVYNALEDWNSDQYREDIKSSQKWVDFCSKESGILLLTIVKRLSGLPFPAGLQPTEIPSLQNIIEKDILDYHSGQQSTT
ncbi:hypothetical protein F5880DRAFT_1681048 [Lentinula raphanica]|nr:hypothetical protein F5880DRAFT_1681048 [Lentinula raphanica]